MTTHIINTDTLGLARFTEFEKGIAEEGGVLFSANADSLLKFALEDPGVECAVSTGFLDFKSEGTKNLIFLEVHGKFPGGVAVSVTREHLGRTSTVVYNRGVRENVEAERTTRIPLGHSRRGVYWKVRVSNKDGRAFSLRRLSAFLNILWREK